MIFGCFWSFLEIRVREKMCKKIFFCGGSIFFQLFNACKQMFAFAFLQQNLGQHFCGDDEHENREGFFEFWHGQGVCGFGT